MAQMASPPLIYTVKTIDMKHLMLLATISICLIACSTSADKTSSDNIDVVKNYIKAVESMDSGAIDKYLDNNYLGMGPSFGDSIGKKEAVENWNYNTANLYEKIHYNRSRFADVIIREGENKGDWVANWAELQVVYKSASQPVTIWANTNYLIKNGKILKSISFYNEADAFRQLGYKFVPPGQAE